MGVQSKFRDSDIPHVLSELEYLPETGNLYWKSIKRGKSNNIHAGEKTEHGYVRISLKGKRYYAHHIVWLFENGQWPTQLLDHINGNRSDNRIQNIREATHEENMRNRKISINNKSGVTGVCWITATKLWMASISLNAKPKHLGHFKKLEDAIEARKSAEARFYKEFAPSN